MSSSVLGHCEKHLLTTNENDLQIQKLPQPSHPPPFPIGGKQHLLHQVASLSGLDFHIPAYLGLAIFFFLDPSLFLTHCLLLNDLEPCQVLPS